MHNSTLSVGVFAFKNVVYGGCVIVMTAVTRSEYVVRIHRTADLCRKGYAALCSNSHDFFSPTATIFLSTRLKVNEAAILWLMIIRDISSVLTVVLVLF